MTHRLDQLSANIVINNYDVNQINDVIIMPNALAQLVEQQQNLWFQIVDIVIFSGGFVYGSSWKSLLDCQYVSEMSCVLTEHQFNAYFLTELDNQGLSQITTDDCLKIFHSKYPDITIDVTITSETVGHGLLCGCFTEQYEPTPNHVDQLYIRDQTTYILDEY